MNAPDPNKDLNAAISLIAAAHDRLAQYARGTAPFGSTSIDMAYVVAAAYLLDSAELALTGGRK